MPDFTMNSLRRLRIVLRKETVVCLSLNPENYSTWLFSFALPIHSDGRQIRVRQRIGQSLSPQDQSDGHLFFVAETGSMRKIILTSPKFNVSHFSKGSPLLLVQEKSARYWIGQPCLILLDCVRRYAVAGFNPAIGLTAQ